MDPNGKPTLSAHPGKLFLLHRYFTWNDNERTDLLILFFTARFSVEDKYSRERITMKRRFGLLLTQRPQPSY